MAKTNKAKDLAKKILEATHAAAVKSGLKGGELIGDVYVRLDLLRTNNPTSEPVKLAYEQWDREVKGYASEMEAERKRKEAL